MLTIEVLKGDITEVDADAIVNPANSSLIMGGGVAGAIKRKGGNIIEEEAHKHAPCPIGKAVITTAGQLKAKYVIHAPTMERPAMRTTFTKVVKAIIAALRKADENNISVIAFPGMGTGVGGLSPNDGARAFREAIKSFLLEKRPKALKKILLVAYDDELFNAFKQIKELIERDIREL